MSTFHSLRRPKLGSQRFARFVSLLMLCGLVIAACAGDEPGEGGATTSAGGATTTVAQATTTAVAESTTTPSAEIDEDVQTSYDEFVADQMPGVTIEQLQAAKDEGRVSYYTGFFGEGNIDGFKDRFPFVRLEVVTLGSGPLAERFSSEKRSGVNEVDVYTAPEGAVLPFIEEGFCQEYTPTSDERFAQENKVEGIAYRWGAGYYGIAFVPERTDPADIEALREWNGLIDPRFQGSVQGVSKSPPGSGTHYAWAALYNEFGLEFLEQHAALAETRVYEGTTNATSALLLGEIDLASVYTISGPVGVYLAGAPIGWTTPNPLLLAPWSGCIASSPPNPNAAALLWEYILSDEGQLTMLPANHSYKIDLDLALGYPEALLEEEWFTLPNFENPIVFSAEQDQELYEEVDSNWNRLYGSGG